MIFEEWWVKKWRGSKNLSVKKSVAKDAWDASRQNLQEYGKHEFCREIWCEHLYNLKTCAVGQDMHCSFTAKEFHRWLLDNGYRVVKDRV